MDTEELEKVKFNEWNKLIKKISKDCDKCFGLSFIPIAGQTGKASQCPSCIPKAKTITYLKESGMNVEDIQKAHLDDMSLLKEKAIYLQGEQFDRQKIGFGILKEEAKLQRKVYFIEMSNLIPELKKGGNKDLIRFDTIYIDSIDIYKTIDQFLLPWFDGILFTFKNNLNKKIIVGGLNNTDGYANRFLETYGTRFKQIFV